MEKPPTRYWARKQVEHGPPICVVCGRTPEDGAAFTVHGDDVRTDTVKRNLVCRDCQGLRPIEEWGAGTDLGEDVA